jgi:hypothetical protein
MTPVRSPLRVLGAIGESYYVVWDAADKVIARGTWELCDAVAKGLPIFESQGSLFGPISGAPGCCAFVNNQPSAPTVATSSSGP